MSWPFQRPLGDPGKIRSGAATVGAATALVTDVQTTFGTATMNALAGWDSPIATDFAELAGSAALRLAATGTQLEGSSAVMTTYATLLESAQHAYDDLHGRWSVDQQVVDRVNGLAAPTPDDEHSASSARTRQSGYQSDMQDAMSDLTVAETGAAAAFDASTETLVADVGGLTPEQVFARVTAAWNAVAPSVGSFFASSAPLVALEGLRRNAGAATAARTAVNTWGLANAADLLAYQVKNLELAKVNATTKILGDTSDMRVLRQWFSSQEIIADASTEARAAFSASTTARSSFLASAAATTRLTRGLAVIGIFGAGYDLFANPDDHQGGRRAVDVAVDVTSIGAGGFVLAAGMGLIAVTPVGAAIILGAGVVAGAWVVGSFVYDHWDDITHGLDVAGDWVVDQGKLVIEGVEEGTRWVGGKVEDLGGAMSDAGSSAWNWVTS